MRTVHQVVVGRIAAGLRIDLADCFAKSRAGLEAMGAVERQRNGERNAYLRSGARGTDGLWNVVEGHRAGEIHLRPLQRFKLNRVISLGAFGCSIDRKSTRL